MWITFLKNKIDNNIINNTQELISFTNSLKKEEGISDKFGLEY